MLACACVSVGEDEVGWPAATWVSGDAAAVAASFVWTVLLRGRDPAGVDVDRSGAVFGEVVVEGAVEWLAGEHDWLP